MWRRVLIVTGVAAALMVPGRLHAQEGDPAELLAEGRRAFEREEFERARESLWAYLDATANLTGAARLPQAEALYYIARMEPDASVARGHYEIIVDEFAASSVADEALYRLGVLALVEGRPAEARERFTTLRQNYPFSRFQPELPMWFARIDLAEGDSESAVETLRDGFTRVRAQDLPRELTTAQREALTAEYAYWLGTAYTEAGDPETAAQYWTLLTMDYPNSPHAAEAGEALARLGDQGARPAGEVAIGGPEADAAAEAEPAAEAIAPVDAPPAAEPPAEEEVRPEPELPPADARPPMEDEPPLRDRPVAQPVPVPVAEEQEPPAKFPPSEEELAYIQVGAFASAERAADLSKRLKSEGFDSRVQVAIVDGRGFYRVRIGPFRLPDDTDDVTEQRERLIGLGYPAQQVPAE